MIDIKKRIIELLDKTHVMSLATTNNESPWVADVVFIYDDDFNIYWMSDPQTRHSKTILKNNKVAASITFNPIKKEPSFCIQLEGTAEQLKGVQFQLLIKHMKKRGYPKPTLSQASKILDGDLWYKLTPTKFLLIDEENFEYDRQEFNFS